MSDANANNGAPSKWLTPSTVLLLCTGILVPILAALIPTAIELLKIKDDFSYTSSAITVRNRTAFTVNVRNNGTVPERTVEIWIRQEKGRGMDLDLAGAPPGSKLRDEPGHKVVSVGDLRPSEFAYITGMAEVGGGDDETLPMGQYGGVKGFFAALMVPTRVVSADRTARRVTDWQRPPNATDFAYRVGFWAFVILLVGAVTWAAITRWGRWRRGR